MYLKVRLDDTLLDAYGKASRKSFRVRFDEWLSRPLEIGEKDIYRVARSYSGRPVALVEIDGATHEHVQSYWLSVVPSDLVVFTRTG